MFTTTQKWAIPALAAIAALIGLAACSSSGGADVAAETPTATSSDATPSADQPAGQQDQQPDALSQSTSPPPPAQPESGSQSAGTQPPTQPDAPAPAETTTPTPTDPRNVLEIPDGSTLEVLGSTRLPDGPYQINACYDDDGNSYPHGTTVTLDPYGPGGTAWYYCDDGEWIRVSDSWITEPPDEGPEIELDQADLDPPTDVFEAPVSN